MNRSETLRLGTCRHHSCPQKEKAARRSIVGCGKDTIPVASVSMLGPSSCVSIHVGAGEGEHRTAATDRTETRFRSYFTGSFEPATKRVLQLVPAWLVLATTSSDDPTPLLSLPPRRPRHRLLIKRRAWHRRTPVTRGFWVFLRSPAWQIH